MIQRAIIIQMLVRVGVLVMALDSCLVTWVLFMKQDLSVPGKI